MSVLPVMSIGATGALKTCRVVRLSAAGAIVEGVVDSIDPLVAIRIRTPAGLVAVGASTARIESFT